LYFLISGLVYLGQIIYSTIDHLQNVEDNGFEKLLVIYVLIHSSSVSLFLFALFAVQMTLISTGLTTAEFFKNYLRYRYRPFNEGVFRNWVNFWKTDRSKTNLTFEKIKMLQKHKHLFKSADTDLEIPLASNDFL